jgi:hypothetical protein
LQAWSVPALLIAVPFFTVMSTRYLGGRQLISLTEVLSVALQGKKKLTELLD